jgi:hypothetical protein
MDSAASFLLLNVALEIMEAINSAFTYIPISFVRSIANEANKHSLLIKLITKK